MAGRARATLKGIAAGTGSAVGAYVGLCILGLFVGIGVCASAPEWFIKFYIGFMTVGVVGAGIYFGRRAFRSSLAKRGGGGA